MQEAEVARMKLRQSGFVAVVMILFVFFCLPVVRGNEGPTSKEDRNAVVKQMEEELNALDKKIAELKEKGSETKGEIKAEFKEQMIVLQKKRETAGKKWQAMKEAGENGWHKVRSDANSAVRDLKSFYNSVVDHLKIH